MGARQNPFAKFLTQFKTGDYVFRENDEGDVMYIIQSGRVALHRTIRGKKKQVNTLEKGDFFGEMSVLDRAPRGTDAEVIEDAGIISINGQTFGEMIRSNPEIAVRMLRKYSMRMRQYSEELDQLRANLEDDGTGFEDEPVVPHATEVEPGQAQGQAKAYFVAKESGKIYPVYKDEVLLGRYDSVTGHRPEIDLTEEDDNRNISRRHARLLYKENTYYVAEEIGTMNGTYINGTRIPTGVLTPIHDGDELILCRVPVIFKTSV